MEIRSIISLRTLYENLGDLTINACLVAQLSRHGKVLCISRGVPLWYLDQFREAVGKVGPNVEYCARPGPILAWLYYSMFSRDKFVLFMSPGAIPYTQSHQRTILYVISKIFRNLRFAQIGASYTRLDPTTIRLLRFVTTRQHYMSVRDAGSQAELAKFDIKVPCVPDLAFALGRRPSIEKRYLVLSFRSSPEETDEVLASRLAPLVAQARNLGLEPILFWQVSQDRELANRLSVALDVKVAADIASPRPTLTQAAEIYSRAAAICSNRLHGLLIAAAYGALPFALLRTSEQKVANCFIDCGLGAFVSKRPEEDASLLAQIANPEAMSHTVDEVFVAAKHRLDEYFAGLAD